jgi:hypothetical protein
MTSIEKEVEMPTRPIEIGVDSRPFLAMLIDNNNVLCPQLHPYHHCAHHEAPSQVDFSCWHRIPHHLLLAPYMQIRLISRQNMAEVTLTRWLCNNSVLQGSTTRKMSRLVRAADLPARGNYVNVVACCTSAFFAAFFRAAVVM